MVALVMVALAGGCEKAKPAARPQPRPASLVIDYSRPSSSANDGLQKFVGTVQPMAAMMVSDEMLLRSATRVFGLSGLDGLDRARPLHLLVLDTGSDQDLVLVAKVADAKKLQDSKGTATIETRGGWAVIGKASAVKEVAGYALSVLPSAKVPPQPSATVYLPRLLATHAAGIDGARRDLTLLPGMSGAMGDLFTSYFDGLMSIAHDTDEIQITLDASAEQAALDLAFTPKPGSRLAKFIALQHPSDFHLLGRLPAGSPAFAIVGHAVLGPYHAGMVSLMAKLYRTPGADFVKDIEAVMSAASGEVAMAMRIDHGGMSMIQLLGLDDAKAADAALGRLQDQLATGKTAQLGAMTATFKAVAEPLVHDGVQVRRVDTTYDVSKLPPMSRLGVEQMAPGGVQHTAIATFDKSLLLMIASDVATAAPAAIDAARGKGAYVPPAQTTKLLDAARAHKDSLVMVIDLGGMMAMRGLGTGAPAPFAMSLGAAKGQAHLRLTLPAASLRALRPH